MQQSSYSHARKNRGPNVIILSAAGKPIFVRHVRGGRHHTRDSGVDTHSNVDSNQSNDEQHHQEEEGDEGEDEWATACGILQAIRANVLSFGHPDSDRSDVGGCSSSPLGDIQSIKAGRKLIVFLNTAALTFVAISDVGGGRNNQKKSKRFVSEKNGGTGSKTSNQSSSLSSSPLCEEKHVESEDEDGGYMESEAWIRLQLEYVYSQVIFTLTDQVQTIFQRSPGYDLRTMMGPNVNASLRNLLDRFDPVDLGHGSGCASFLTAGVDCIFPIPPEVRDAASRMLINSCSGGAKSPDSNHSNSNHDYDNPALFGILMVGTRLVTLVQPSDRSSQLHTSDLHLILTFVGRQPGLLTNELWFPICLPRFDSSGFLYAYTSCLDPLDTGLSIVLISHENSTQQFESFRSAANSVRKQLGLPPMKSSVLRFQGDSSSAPSSHSASTALAANQNERGSVDTSSTMSGYSDDSERRRTHYDDAAWKREEENEDEFDNDNDGRDKGIIGRIGQAGKRPSYERTLSVSNYLQKSLIEVPTTSTPRHAAESNNEGPVLPALKIALSPEQQMEVVNNYLQLASAVHFVFRCDVYIGNRSDGATARAPGGLLTQCFGPPLSFPFTDPGSQRQVWGIYQRLGLRLRLGSCSAETTMDALDMITDAQRNDPHGVDSGGISRDCPMQCLLESPPNVHGVTYIQKGDEWLYVGLNGKFFELYATLPGTIPPRTGTAYCARLVRRLMEDERFLFLSNPMTWDS